MKLTIEKDVTCYKTENFKSGEITIELIQIGRTDEATSIIMFSLDSKENDDSYITFEIDRNNAKYIKAYLNAFINEKNKDSCQEI